MSKQITATIPEILVGLVMPGGDIIRMRHEELRRIHIIRKYLEGSINEGDVAALKGLSTQDHPKKRLKGPVEFPKRYIDPLLIIHGRDFPLNPFVYL